MDALLDHAPCGFITFTDQGVITAANQTFSDMLGIDKTELTGSRFDQLLTVAGRIFAQTHFFPMLRLQQNAEEIFLSLKGRDGREVPALLNAKRVICDGAGEIHCTIMPVYQRKKFEADLIAARKAADEALNRNEALQKTAQELEASRQELDRQITRLRALHEEMSEFGHVISHDMQEPVRKILLFADLLDPHNPQPAEERIKLLEKIRTSGLRMRKLVARLEEYMGLGFMGRETRQCDLSVIIEEARRKVLYDTHREDLTLQTGPMPRIEGYPEQLTLLFYQLLMNALQFKKREES